MANDVLIDIKPVHGEEINDMAIIRAVQKEMRVQAKSAENLFEKGYENWQANHKPKWKLTLSVRGTDYVGRMYTGDKPFLWVEAGTKKRRRWMSKDWQSKTTVGILRSSAGAGTPGKFAGKGRQPKPIAARDFRVIVAERMKGSFSRNMQRAVNKGSRRFFSNRRPRSPQVR